MDNKNYFQGNNQGGEKENFNFIEFLKTISGVEFLVIFFIFTLVLVVTLFGYFNQDGKNKDLQKINHFYNTLIPSLNDFYSNSAATESSKFYPIAKCSGNVNEVDFEFTLRNALTGLSPELDSHVYINPVNYPKDVNGVYSKNLEDRKVQYRCTEKLNFSTTQSKSRIYPDGYDSCNFSASLKFNNCYLYTSSAVGDSYQLGFYSNTDRCFKVFSQFRNQDLSVNLACS